MKRCCFTLCALACLTSCWATAGASLENGSFESGDFRGWTLDNPREYSLLPLRRRPELTAEVVSDWGREFGLFPLRQAVDGCDFAALGGLGGSSFERRSAYYDIILYQTIALAAGNTLSGWAFFYDNDPGSSDCAWVKICDASGREVATPWLELSGGGANNCSEVTPWTRWQWESPVNGLYTVKLGVRTKGGDDGVSYGFFDDICMQATTVPPVPEPGVFALWSVGALLLAARRLQSRSSLPI